jgi:hypothetical protein
MANPTGSAYLQANSSYTWTDGDIYEIVQTDQQEGAATGASFGGIGVDNQPHQVLLNKVQWLYTRITTWPHSQTVLTVGSGTFIVPSYVTGVWVRGWGKGGNGGGSVTGYPTSGGGGGGGAYFEGVLTVTPGQGIAWLINSSGSAFGAWEAGAGTNGVSATASVFGGGGSGGSVFGSPPIGFIGTSGEVGRAVVVAGSPTAVILGEGGQSFGCGHAHFGWVPNTGAFNGASGIYPGQGGSGGGGGGVGGTGGPGMIIVQW